MKITSDQNSALRSYFLRNGNQWKTATEMQQGCHHVKHLPSKERQKMVLKLRRDERFETIVIKPKRGPSKRVFRLADFPI